MQEIIDWQKGIEHKAGDFYREAALYFSDDRLFSDFLSNLAKDEVWHLDILEEASEYLHERAQRITPSITLCNETKSRVREILTVSMDRLASRSFTKDEMLDCIVNIEFSEMNAVFLYIITELKKYNKNLRPMAPKIQAHIDSVENFINSFSEKDPLLTHFKSFPSVWQESILIVDDEPAITGLLSSILKDKGKIDTAGNGYDALDKVSAKYYAAIVSDVDMPKLNGIDFFKKAADAYPSVKHRFLFLTGAPTSDRIEFFSKNNLAYIPKPVPITELKKGVETILKNTASTRSRE